MPPKPRPTPNTPPDSPYPRPGIEIITQQQRKRNKYMKVSLVPFEISNKAIFLSGPKPPPPKPQPKQKK